MAIKVLSTDQIREADKFTIRHEPISSTDLMERAAEACAIWISDKVRKDLPLVFFCGTGNNGGDGLAIARLLSIHGFSTIDIRIAGDPETGSNDFQINLERLREVNITATCITEPEDLHGIPSHAVLIDALLGNGLNRPVDGLYLKIVHFINTLSNEVISIDIPSGMFGEDNSSNSIDGIVLATHTLTFQQPKLAFLLSDAGERSGSWHILDIGLSKAFIDTAPSTFYLSTKEDIEQLEPERKKFSHKGTYGHALLVAGSKGMVGAAVLATRAALRSGVGLVTTMAPRCGYSILQSTAPEAICMDCGSENTVSGKTDWSRFDAIGIGPGIGKDPLALETLSKLLEEYSGFKVIDADALNLIAENKALLKLVDRKTILTPHPGEFDRLFGKCTSAFKRLLLLQIKAKEHDCYILLKGAHTAISMPNGNIYFNNTGNPGMAKGGSGDVLTGFLTGKLAALKDPRAASLIAAWRHGDAGEIIAKDLGQELMTALDLTNFLS